jgi:GABA(A) receptor-associated protein
MSCYKDKYSFNERIQESTRIMCKYSSYIPIIVEKHNKSNLNDITKKKFLVPSEFILGQFIHVLRKKINLSPNISMFVFINNKIPCISETISTIYEENKDKDGFLYVTYCGMETFG